MKSVFWRAAKRLSHIGDARCLKIKTILSWYVQQCSLEKEDITSLRNHMTPRPTKQQSRSHLCDNL